MNVRGWNAGRFGVAGGLWLFALACASSGVSTGVYVGVAGPGPWYGYPGRYPMGPGYPGMVGGGVVIGYPCCEDDDEDDGLDAASALDWNDEADVAGDSARIDVLRERRAAGVEVLHLDANLQALQDQKRDGARRYE